MSVTTNKDDCTPYLTLPETRYNEITYLRNTMMAAPSAATARIQPKKQTLDDAYAPPANFLEIDVISAETHGIGKKRYTDYEVHMRVS